MDHIKVLKRAWEITWRYRVLWIFGIILALTAGGGGGGNGPQATFGGNGGGNGNGNGGFPPPGDFSMPEIPPQVVATLIAIGVALACVIVFLIVVATIVRYVAETALIRMVDDHEETGEQRSVRQGFRLGWSRTALRLFLIDLLIGLPVAVVFILLFLMPSALLLLSVLALATYSTIAGVIGIIASIGLILLLVLLIIVVAAILSPLMQFFRRACALEEVGVIEAIRRGYDIVRRHLKDVALMWLIMVGLGLGWTIAMIPVMILLLITGIMLGGFPALLIGGLASLAFEGAVPWILAGAVGFPIFILVVAVPGLFLGGLMEVFKSSTWTLTYRELRALEGLETETETEEWSELDEPGTA